MGREFETPDVKEEWRLVVFREARDNSGILVFLRLKLGHCIYPSFMSQDES